MKFLTLLKTIKNGNIKDQNLLYIDFYADWCGPCKAIAPVLEELSNEYEEIVIYKLDTEEEQNLSAMFGIRSIPSILFIPMEKQPMMQAGALPKAAMKQVIEIELLGIEKA